MATDERMRMQQGAMPPVGEQPQDQQRAAPKKQKPRKGTSGLTPEQAKVIADRFKAQRSGQPGRRMATGSPFDPWKHDIIALVKEDLRNGEIIRHIRMQDRRFTATSTKLRGWLKREGIRVPKTKTKVDDVTDGD